MSEREWKAATLDERRILGVLAERPEVAHTHQAAPMVMPPVYDPDHPDAPTKVLLAKLRRMAKRGLVDGCGCGCRGDWRITDKGQRVLDPGPG